MKIKKIINEKYKNEKHFEIQTFFPSLEKFGKKVVYIYIYI